MKKIFITFILIAFTIGLCGQISYKTDVIITKTNPILWLDGLNGQLKISGATSGTAIIKAKAVAGTPTFTIPSTTGVAIIDADTAGMLLHYLHRATTVGSAFLNLANPSAITFPRINADNTVTALSQANYKTALSLTSSDVGLGNVTNESKATMFTNSVLTDHPTIEGVTSTGATGTGNLVFSNTPTIDNANLTGNTTIANDVDFPDALFDETEIFYAKDYDVTGDGTDETAEIQAAIDAATLVNGTVYLPQGTYSIKSPLVLKSNITFKGAGRGQTIIKAMSTWHTISKWDGMLSFAIYAQNIKIENLTLDGNMANNYESINGIGEYSPSRIAAGAPYYGHSSPRHIDIINVEVKNTSHSGIHFESVATALTTDILFDNCYIHGCGDTLSYPAGMYFNYTRRVKITNTVIDSCYSHGIYLAGGSDFEITNSSFTNNGFTSPGGGGGLSIRADSNVVVSNNIMARNKDYGLAILKSTGWYTGTRCRNVIASNNLIYDNLANSAPYAQVYLWLTENAKLTNNIINKTGVVADSATNIGVWVVGNNRYLTISNNQIANSKGIILYGDTLRNVTISNNNISYMNFSGKHIKGATGIKLHHTHPTSNEITVINNVIDTCYNGIWLHSLWEATNTRINNNIIAKAINSQIKYQSSKSILSFPVQETISVTIGWDGATGCDFVWTGDAGHAAQNLDLGSIIPIKADVVKVDIVCTQALVGCTDITIGAGNASGGAQYVAAASLDDLNEVITSTAVLTDAVLMNNAAATKVWISGDPSDNNWSDMTAGKWIVHITYLNYIGR